MLLKIKRISQAGFTGIEVLMVLVVVIIVAILITNNITESNAKARDLERSIEILIIHEELEKYWHDNEHYPGYLFNELSDLARLTDPDGREILALEPIESNTKPSVSFGEGTTNPEQDYVYAPYDCDNVVDNIETNGEEDTQDDSEADETKTVTCKQYTLYTWTESNPNTPYYQRDNLHNSEGLE